MKATLALLLIAVGLYIVYEVLSGGSQIINGTPMTPTTAGNNPNLKIAPTVTANQLGIYSGDYRAPGGAISKRGPAIPPPIIGPGETPKDPTTGEPVGGDMVSLQSRARRIWE